MLTFTRTTSADKDFLSLTKALDQHLAITDGDDHAIYNQYNKLDDIKHVVVAYDSGKPAGCGAIKVFEESTYEVKRMFVDPLHRGKGIAAAILTNLEAWTRELGADYCILETGTKLEAAIRLYERQGYQKIPCYNQYQDMPDSVCLKKKL